MNQKSQKMLLIGKYISITAFFVFLLWMLFKIVSTFNDLEKEIKVPIIAGFFALLVVAFTYLRENYLKRQEAHRTKKIEIYSVFFEMIGRIMKDTHTGGESSFTESSEFIDQMLNLKKNLMFYGSPSVLKAFNEFQNKSGESQTSIQVIDRVGNLLLAMRKDVGLSNFGLNARELNQIIVKENIRELVSQGISR
jgi:hypothetical protein